MNLLFPHEKIREVQDLFINDLKETLQNKAHLLAHAPTGLGKTASVLSTTLPYALENKKTIFFLTNRHTQHKIAIETLIKIKEKHNVDFKVIDLIGKKWMCLQPSVTTLSSSEFSDYCNDLVEKKQCDFYNNLKDKGNLSLAARQLLESINEPLPVEKMIGLCREKHLCPYEITSLLGKNASVVVADYYHILDPHIRDTLLTRIEKALEDSIIIFDEAHNIDKRARELLSINLSTFVLDNAIKEIKFLNYEEIGKDVEAIKQILFELTDNIPIDEQESLIAKEQFMDKIKQIADYNEIIGNLQFITEQVLEIKQHSFCNTIAKFLMAWLGPDESFIRYLKREFVKDKVSLTLTYRCLDPSLIIKPISEEALVIGMSGTLTPLNMYQDLFGFKAVLKEYGNPFPQENRLNIITPNTTTKFTKRTTMMYKKIAVACSTLLNNIPGNCIVFFPSYQIRDDVNEFLQKLVHKTTFIEQQGLTKEEKEELIESFKSYKDHGAVLLATSSGSLGEGIDLPGDFLKAVIIVGLPLAKPNLETKELIKYYDNRFKKGWDYGYIYPAIIRIMQNAGRCIRSKHDKGVIIFLDERYIWENYFKCFPKNYNIIVSREPEKLVSEFFNKEKHREKTLESFNN